MLVMYLKLSGKNGQGKYQVLYYQEFNPAVAFTLPLSFCLFCLLVALNKKVSTVLSLKPFQ